MSGEYTHNHYVPEWYQRRFILPGQKDNELFYLNLNPGEFTDPRGVRHSIRPVKRQGVRHCFAIDNLYTATFAGVKSTDIEKIFFGEIDRNGHRAVDYFANYNHFSVNGEAHRNIMLYMSTQKLRTPKGLAYLSDKLGTHDQREVLKAMLQLRQIYCAIWTECIWQIADASQSETKFIISDHPVTVYNRRCAPNSRFCHGNYDPNISMHGTHTIFPLSLERILILTNLSWVRNPYQRETALRPNPNPRRSAIFKFMQIQTSRSLTQEEVRQINFIIKSRALRHIAAAKEEWLLPEQYVSQADWRFYGYGYLLMPDPRAVHLGGQMSWGNADGTGGSVDEYGRRPWEPDYNKEGTSLEEGSTLYRFQGEFARIVGPYRRGRSSQFGDPDVERDSEDLHNYHLGLEQQFRR